jgi:glycosyltransferase involved in cell wall biosynthesis
VRLLLFILEKINIFLAKEIITVSEDMLSEFKKITKKKTILIHKGSACGFVIPKKKLYEKNFRVKLGFSKKDFLVAFIGRLEKRKGYNLALKIWKEYFLKQKNIKLLIYGTAMKKKYEKNLKKNVYYMGYTNDIPTVLSNIDCLILPSKHEGFSYVALEAIAYNCPVIATNIPGLRNLLTKDKNSILLKSFSTLDYAKGITEIKKRAIKKITIPKFINKYDRKKFMISYLKFLQAKKH